MKKKTKYIHVGSYVAEVTVELIEANEGWSPYLSVSDARKLDAVRKALENKDFKAASQYGSVYRLEQIAP